MKFPEVPRPAVAQEAGLRLLGTLPQNKALWVLRALPRCPQEKSTELAVWSHESKAPPLGLASS
jgi:hypothetical protein